MMTQPEQRKVRDSLPVGAPSGIAASVVLGALLGLLCGACGDDNRGNAPDPVQPSAEPSANAAADPATAATTPGAAEETPPALATTDVPEASFVETDENRDPFRAFVEVFIAQNLPEEELLAPRPAVLLNDVDVEQMRLVAIVSGEEGNPRAMVIDPQGKGWVIQRGDYLGRGERVRLGPGRPDREINWRVVRVRPDRVIMVRDDPIQSGPPVTRVMKLYPEQDG